MGWLFGRKKKKSVSSGLQDDKSLSFGQSSTEGKLLKPDQFKAAAGLDSFSSQMGSSADLGMGDSTESLGTDVWGQLDSGPSSNGRSMDSSLDEDQENSELQPLGAPLPQSQRIGAGRMTQDYKYIQVKQYKRVLGELKDLQSELSHMDFLGKSLDKAEYNEEKNFLRLKETMRKVHDKTLLADRTLFGG